MIRMLLLFLGLTIALALSQPGITAPTAPSAATGQDRSENSTPFVAQTKPASPPPQDAEQPPLRFAAIDIYLDCGDHPLAAYQVELRADAAAAQVVGIEGGEHPAFAAPPRYDPAALHENQLTERIVLAAFSLNDALPTGRTRIARLHIQVRGEMQLESRLEAAGAPDGTRLEGHLEILPRP